MPIVQNYSTHPSYYTVNGRPFLSTYSGGTQTFGSSSVNDFWTTAFQQYNLNPYFVPDFDNAPNYPADFFTTFPITDGAFSWETAWGAPNSPAGTNVSDSVDTQVIQEAHAAGKVYMMRKTCPVPPEHPNIFAKPFNSVVFPPIQEPPRKFLLSYWRRHLWAEDQATTF